MHKLASHEQSIDPPLPEPCRLPQFAFGSLDNAGNRPEAIEKACSELCGLRIERREKLDQVPVSCRLARRWWSIVPRPVTKIAIHTGQRSMIA